MAGWLDTWSSHYGVPPLRVRLRPHRAGSELLQLSVTDPDGTTSAHVIFANIRDRKGENILSVRDQEVFGTHDRQQRLMTLLHLFLLHRYQAISVHYLSPTDNNLLQTSGMKRMKIYSDVSTEVGHIIVADVDVDRVEQLMAGRREYEITFGDVGLDCTLVAQELECDNDDGDRFLEAEPAD